MRKTLAAALAALTAGGAMAATVLPTTADARPYGHYYGHRGNGGAAVAAGIAGLAIGAAIASDHPRYYSYGYGPAYYDYGPGPYYGGYYGTCVTRHWVWDPYLGRHVLVHERVPC